MGDALQTRFRTDWDTESNPAYDVWTSVNGLRGRAGGAEPVDRVPASRTCHSPASAREFGIPAVVMCKDATRIIHEGDTVTVDGAAGTVTIVERV